MAAPPPPAELAGHTGSGGGGRGSATRIHLDIDASKIKDLKEFIENVEQDFTILDHPDLGFFRDFLNRLDAKIPAHPAPTDGDRDYDVIASEIPEDSTVPYEKDATSSVLAEDQELEEARKAAEARVAEEARKAEEEEARKAEEARVAEEARKAEEEEARKAEEARVAEEARKAEEEEARKAEEARVAEEARKARLAELADLKEKARKKFNLRPRKATQYPKSRTPCKSGKRGKQKKAVKGNPATTSEPTSQDANPVPETLVNNEDRAEDILDPTVAPDLSDLVPETPANNEERAEDVSDPTMAPDEHNNIAERHPETDHNPIVTPDEHKTDQWA